MMESKLDPRIQRTRKLIMDAFIELSGKKEFKDITVKDITAEAMINRATFYYHFEDIYDLLEKVLSEVLSVNLDCQAYRNETISEEALIRIFVAITEFQKSLSTRCHRGYEDTIARIIREQLDVLFRHMLKNQDPTMEEDSLKLVSVMLSWAMYGASVEWRKHGQKDPPEPFIRRAIPTIMQGLKK